jgi:biofilm PGA synthesis N-glycosyltransferase PgaC
VSDGSTDKTDEIVQKAAFEQDWIEFIRMPPHDDRQFAAKANCFNTGYKMIRSLEFDLIGNLDADLSFDSDYFEYLLVQFVKYPELGVAGTPFVQEESSVYDYRFTNIEHVSGACQLFRRKCFEEIGGYLPLKGGGIDWVAVTTARMKGWKTKTFTEKTIFHHRRIGTGKETSALIVGYSQGRKDYNFGNHPLWELLRAFYQMRFKPYVLGGFVLFLGYLMGAVRRVNRPIPHELIEFNQKEQMKRLAAKLRLKKWSV